MYMHMYTVMMRSIVYYASSALLNRTSFLKFQFFPIKLVAKLSFYLESFELLVTYVVSLFTCPVDVIQVLNQSLDAQWRHFGTHLCVDSAILDSIDKDKSNVGACMLQLVEKWLAHENGTGDLPRTWETVVQAVKKTGKRPLVQILAQCHDVQRKSSEAYEVIKRLQHPPQVRISQGCASI